MIIGLSLWFGLEVGWYLMVWFGSVEYNLRGRWDLERNTLEGPEKGKRKHKEKKGK